MPCDEGLEELCNLGTKLEEGRRVEMRQKQMKTAF